jgi:hypothetical protein
MNNALGEKVLVNVAVAGAVILVGYFLLRNLAEEAVSEGAAAIAGVNKDTPFAGFGAVGTLGNAVNRVLGGAPAKIGSYLGGKLADLTGK